MINLSSNKHAADGLAPYVQYSNNTEKIFSNNKKSTGANISDHRPYEMQADHSGDIHAYDSRGSQKSNSDMIRKNVKIRKISEDISKENISSSMDDVSKGVPSFEETRVRKS